MDQMGEKIRNMMSISSLLLSNSHNLVGRTLRRHKQSRVRFSWLWSRKTELCILIRRLKTYF